jgi:hypothetical protein
MQADPFIGTDPYTALFVLGMIVTAAGLVPLGRVREGRPPP